MRLVRSASAAGLACCALTAAGTAGAQSFGGIEQAPQYSRGYNTAVRERPHPEWAPIDLDLGGFTLQPQIALTTLYNSNEKYASENAQSDVSFRIQPALQLGSNWNRNGFGLTAFLAQTEYARFSEDDSTEYGVTGTGRLDVQNDLTVDLRASDQHLVLARSDPDVPVDSLGPAMFDRQNFQGTVTKTLPRFQLQGVVAVRNEDYGHVGAPDGGEYDFTGRNGTYTSYSGRVSYGLSPAVAVFVGGLYDQSFRPKFNNVAQDADGVNLAGGVNFDLTRLARGEIAVGYLYQEYDTPNTPADSGVAFSANLQYFPTQLTTISISADRNSAPASVAGSPGGISLDGSVTVDHELLRNVILTAGAQAGQIDYRNFRINNAVENRTDRSYGGSLGATYLMNRLVSWEAQYAYVDYHSTDALRRSYTDSRLSLTLRLTR
jgi:hypothetical protein